MFSFSKKKTSNMLAKMEKQLKESTANSASLYKKLHAEEMKMILLKEKIISLKSLGVQ